MMKTKLFLFMLLYSMNIFSQVGINTSTPNTNSSLDIDSKNGTKGVVLPKINNSQEATLLGSLGSTDIGLTYYNTETSCVNTWNGNSFNKLCEQGNAEYTADCPNSSIYGYYRQGKVTTSNEYIKLSINVTKEGPYNISGTSGNGYYFSASGYLTKGYHDLVITAAGTPTNIGNNTIKLINNLTSKEICSFNINVVTYAGAATINCNNLPAVSLIKDNNNSVPVSIPINVTQTGPISISTTSQNGVSFAGNGDFATTGPNTLVIYSGGIPEIVGNYTYTLEGEGINSPICNLNVTVLNNNIQPETTVGTITVYGDYLETIDYSASESVSVQGIRYTDPSGGAYGVGIRYVGGGSGNPGLSFENKTGTLPGPQTLNLTFPATPGTIPNKGGTYTYELYDIYSGLSLLPQFTIEVKYLIGTFQNPAKKCTEVLNQRPGAADGYYWVTDNANINPTKYKTYCDMSNGGWTLVKSISEKTIFTERTQNESLNSQRLRGAVTTENGIFNEYNFSLNATTVNTLSGGNVWPKYVRFTIKEKGHTTATGANKDQIESSTVAPINDSWAKNNYWNVTVLSNYNPSTGNIAGYVIYRYYTSEGKLFGFPWGKASTANNIHTFDGQNFSTTNPQAFYSQTNFFTGFYGGRGYVGNTSSTKTYTTSNGSTATFRLYDINDLFGLYMNSEAQLNHHIGTCANSQDDYGGESFCNAGWNNWRPHKFNNGEGRIYQVWTK